jgi:ankyrin repeat protein
MNTTTIKTISLRALAFAGTTVLSMAIMNSLPRVKEQRQRAFFQATLDGRLYRMRWLHFAGASVNARGNAGSPLFIAAGEGNLNAVRYLLDEGADANTRGASGVNALSEAAYYGHLSVVKELLLRGADINALSDGGTALDIAVGRNNKAVADLLKHRGGKTSRELRSGG